MNKLFIATSFTFISIGQLIQAQNNIEIPDSIVNELQEIVVTAKQPTTKLIGSTLVSTIAGSRLQNIGTCLDVLAQLPLITVQDKNVTIIGKGTPEIYINGRPLRDSDELHQLQSFNIKRVELLTAPGAMYSSETKAVLKITTRQKFIDGLSLTERAEVSATRKLSANNLLDLSYRAGNLDFFTTGTIARNNRLIKGSTTNTLIYQGRESEVGSSQQNSYPSNNGTIKAGFNFADNKQSFGSYYRFNPERGKFKNIGSEWLNNNKPLDRNIDHKIKAQSHLISTYYDYKFTDQSNLHFDGNFRHSTSSNDIITSYPNQSISEVASTDKRTSDLWAGKLYISFPAWNGTFIVGTQDSYTHTSLNYLMMSQSVGEYIPSSSTDAKQTSVAAFVTWDRSFGQLNLSAGLRYEYVDYLFQVNGKNDNDVSRTDNLLTPDLSIGWNFNDQTQINLSYRMTTIKPPYSQLTGSLSYVGQHEIEGGNPSLKDEKRHGIQLFAMCNDFMLQADYTRSIDTYGFVKRLYPANSLQLIMQPTNMNVSALKFYFIWNKNISFWTPSFTVGIYRQWLRLDATNHNHPIFSYYFDNTVSLPNNFLLTLNAHGRTKGDMHTNRFENTWFSSDISISKSFFNKSLQIKMSATDIFNTSNSDWTMNTYGVFVNKQQSIDYREISLSATYRFNPKKSKYKGQNASDSEMERL